MKTITEEIVDEAIAIEQTRWQNAIYKILVEETDDTIDGGGCDSCDPLDFTLDEIMQAIMFWKDRSVEWTLVSDENSPHGIPVWLWAEEWIDEDFNPEGVREGFYVEGEGYISAGWEPTNDVFTTEENSKPTHWAMRTRP